MFNFPSPTCKPRTTGTTKETMLITETQESKEGNNTYNSNTTS